MAVSFVAGTAPVTAAANTTIDGTSPAGLADGDCLLAYISTSTATTFTPPGGWELVEAAPATDGGSSYLSACYRKTTVVTGDSSTPFTFTAADSGDLAITMAAFRGVTAIGKKAHQITSSASAWGVEQQATRAGAMFVAFHAAAANDAATRDLEVTFEDDWYFDTSLTSTTWTGSQAGPTIVAGYASADVPRYAYGYVGWVQATSTTYTHVALVLLPVSSVGGSGIQPVASTQLVSGSSATAVAPAPLEIADGDYLFAFVRAESTVTPPADWTEVAAENVAGTVRMYVFQKDEALAADEGVSFEFDLAASADWDLAYLAVRDLNNGVLGISATTDTIVSATNVTTAPGIEATVDDSLLVYAVGVRFIAADLTYPYIRSDSSNIQGLEVTHDLFTRDHGYGDRMMGYYVVADALDSPVITTGLPISGLSDNEHVYIALVLQSNAEADVQTVSDGIVFTEVIEYPDFRTVSDGIRMNSVLRDVRRQMAAAADAIEIDPAMMSGASGARIHERLSLTRQLAPVVTYRQVLAQAMRIADRIIGGEIVTASDAIELDAAIVATNAVTVVEALHLARVVGPSMIFGRSLADSLGVRDTLARFFSGVALDTIEISTTMGGMSRSRPVLNDGVTLDAEIEPRMIVRVTAQDTLALNAVQALQMLFKPSAADGIEISAAYIAPDGSVTTWAVNTRTGATTEYMNYDFNSFAKIGNRYIAGAASGLYELAGDDDAGEDVIATLESGLMQFAGAHLSSFKGAYIATRGGGDFVLRLETGDGRVYDYEVTTHDMLTTKINLGKGLRARYFSFRLVSTGQDFDLESLEFIPLVAQRRV